MEEGNEAAQILGPRLTSDALNKQGLTWTNPVAIVGLAVLVGFGALTVFMTSQVNNSEPTWARLVYVFGSVEAVAFAAAGALFGAQVQRGQTQRAERRAEEAQQKADRHADAAARGRALAKTIRVEWALSRLGPPITPPEQRFRFAPRQGGSEVADPAIARLGALADELFPQE
jgi:hypothetical protein